MAKDPLKIIGHPNPTPAEREQAEALAKASGRPSKFCRAALLEAGGDPVKARALLEDKQFILMNTDFDLNAMESLGDNPMALMDYVLRQQAAHAGKSEAELHADPNVKRLRRGLAAYEAERPQREAHERRVKKTKGTKLTDPVLGRLTWDLGWERRVDVPAFGKMDLHVDTDREADDIATPPTDAHRNAFTAFMRVAEKLYPKVENANFKYWQRVRPAYEAPGWDLPNPKDARALWKALSHPTLYIPLQDGKSWRAELSWACDWDVEHGHAVYIKGGRIVNVGIQGEGYEPG